MAEIISDDNSSLADIHVHSDTSHRPWSILRVVNEFNVPAYKGKTVEEVRADIQAPPGSNWDTWYSHMTRTRQAYVSPRAIGALIEDVLTDAANNGVDLIELRISLLSTVQALMANLGVKDPKEYARYTQLVFDEIIKAAERQAGKIDTDMVVSISSQQKYRMYLEDLLKFCRDYKDHITALDITYEKGDPPSSFAREVESVRGDIRFLTIHCMEVMPPERGWDALTLQPDCIGHGIRAIEDPKLVEELRRRGIPLEMCVLGNLVTGTVKNAGEHPMKRLYDAGVKLTVGSDGCNDSSTLKDNYRFIQKSLGFTPAQMQELRKNSWENSFRRLKKIGG
ncbi:hypothetical protein HZA42_01505 [Candidatus Peregrinibacteria bacterium]|nr:hypothetical protein [Candidatus Peregrinibacteria bacterium]